MSAGEAERRLPAAGVAFDASFARRLEALHLRLVGLWGRREGGARGTDLGEGLEFAGHRPYRPGEDLRRLDWQLLGRLDRLFVRLTRREAAERWTVLVDTSASMGVGPAPQHGKLQWAAEVTAGLAAAGLDAGASVRIAPSGAGCPGDLLRRKADLWAWLGRASTWRAAGTVGGPALLDPARVRGSDRVFCVGDWLGVAPSELYRVFARGRGVTVLQVLAPEEIVVPEELRRGGVEWLDAEGPGTLRVVLAPDLVRRYERRVEAELERWRSFCARHRVPYSFWTSADAFEDAVLAVAAR